MGLLRHHPDRLLGVHYSDVYAGYPRIDDPSPEEAEYFASLDQWSMTEGAYAMEHGTKPTTLAVGLTDSPAGLAAWVLEKFRTWSGDGQGEIEDSYSLDDLATIVSIYWFTGTIGSSVRLYKEAFADGDFQQPMPDHRVPQGVLVPPAQGVPAPRSWAERYLQNLVRYNVAERGGHFPALETPELFARDIRAFHREIMKLKRVKTTFSNK